MIGKPIDFNADTVNNYPDSPFTFEFQDNSTWLMIKPRKIEFVRLNARNVQTGSFITTDPDPRFSTQYNFLMPKSFQIYTQHRWKEFTNVVGVSKEMLSAYFNAGSQVQAITKNVISNMSIQTANNTAVPVKGDDKTMSLANKNDSPVIYDDSDRRKLIVEVSLSCYEDPKKEVFDPIQDILAMSSPDVNSDDYIQFDFPYVFEIGIGPLGSSSMFEIKNAIIKAVIPTYNAPYVDGYPTSATMTIEFEDADPLYRSNSFTNKKVSFGVKENRGVLDSEKDSDPNRNPVNDTGTKLQEKNVYYYTKYKDEVFRVERIKADKGILEAKNARYLLYGVGYITVPPTIPIPPIL